MGGGGGAPPLTVYHSSSCVFGRLRRGYPSAVAGLQRECVTGEDLFKHVPLRTQTAERRCGGGARKSPRVEGKIKTPPRSPFVDRNIHYASPSKPRGFVAPARRTQPVAGETLFVVSPGQKDDGAAPRPEQRFQSRASFQPGNARRRAFIPNCKGQALVTDPGFKRQMDAALSRLSGLTSTCRR